MDRREFLALTAAGGSAVFASGLAGCANLSIAGKAREDFYFVQLSDTHVGYQGPDNPDVALTLRKAMAAVNALPTPPDFIVFTGDLIDPADAPAERRRRLAEFKSIVADFEVKTVRFLPGETDAGRDGGAMFEEFFGNTFYSFDHKGVHFVALDSGSNPGARIGGAKGFFGAPQLGAPQLNWLKDDLARRSVDTPIVVLTHYPLFDLAPQWGWATRDGAQAIELLMPYRNVTVLYGHIHQEHHHMTGHIAHHAAKSLISPFPVPGSQPDRTQLRWDPSAPYKGLGFREIEADDAGTSYKLIEFPIGLG
ncbi:metallophosphoesterase family protein [Roseateles saccharophilus]|uniref:3',5'-cyclic AMP phosphodiesterase CpdA n=1 Tax=Roseateles saccharophilus TaxID=304 RepID=A0A4R3UKH2_ROSSA|nr:metallophosphoesterase [Roseateles saccharophilus]MDG0833615.1 metallophosphoesterase [Roseateles saccharophilus]TCU92136.1 3',5'-cyclic AMP phosphodiesterase CpdA [Roseateles saccharophilus]